MLIKGESGLFPTIRPRRLRENSVLRSMIRETYLSVDELILPVFVTHGIKIKNPIKSMPGIFQLSIDELLKEVEHATKLGILSVIIFGIPNSKNPKGFTGICR